MTFIGNSKLIRDRKREKGKKKGRRREGRWKSGRRDIHSSWHSS
jgi:hypothetical protein